LKFGADVRALFLNVKPFQSFVEYIADSVPDFLTTSQATLYATSTHSSRILSQAISVYGQDTWRLSPLLTMTYGLRWELSPAPSARGNTILTAWQNVSSAPDLGLAPMGTKLWSTTYTNFSPRIGIAYSPRGDGRLVFRAGFGIFYDLGSDTVGSLAS